MNIFIDIVIGLSALLSGFFFRTAWVNYKKEGIRLNRYWYNTIPYTVVKPFCYAVFFLAMWFFYLTI